MKQHPRPASRVRRNLRPSRRVVLGGLLGSTIGLPWLESLQDRRSFAQTGQSPRFVAMFSANGTIYDRWVPSGTESDFDLSPILAPLAPHQADLVVVAGLSQQGGGGDGHQNGIGGMLTGAELLPGRFAGQGSAPAGWSEGPSVDQRIAEHIGSGVPFRSLEFGVQTGAADNWGRMCYRARNEPLTPREDPAQTFDDLFGFTLLAPDEQALRQARNTSILDHVREEFMTLADEVGSSDRQRLELHLTHLREVERRLAQQSEQAAACALPERPDAAQPGNDNYPNTGDAMLELLVLALACGRTNVASLQWSRSVSPVRFTWLGVNRGHHELSHLPDDDAEAQDQLVAINTWYAERFAALIERLKAYDLGDTTLFDHCLLLWCNELGKGNTHSRERAPYVLAGSAGGALGTGRFLNFPDALPHNNLLVSLLNIMGIPDESFGRPEWCTGPLRGLV